MKFNIGEAPPPEVRAILNSILYVGLLVIRGQASNQNAESCCRQAEHLHNLPSLLNDYSSEMLDFYWNSSRVGYRNRAEESELKAFESLWAQLEPFVANKKRVEN